MKKLLFVLISACLLVGIPSCKRAMKKMLNDVSHSVGMDGSKDIADVKTLEELKETLLSKCDTEKLPIYGINLYESEECTGRALVANVELISADGTNAYYQNFYFNGNVSELNDHGDGADVTPIDLKALDVNMIAKGIDDAKSQIPEGYTYKTIRNMSVKDGVTSITMALTKDGEETITNAGQTSAVYYDALFDIDNATGKATDKN